MPRPSTGKLAAPSHTCDGPVLLDDGGLFDGVHIFPQQRVRSSAAQPHFQRSAAKLPSRAASEVQQRRRALPRPQSACNLGRAYTEGAPSRRPLLSTYTEGASSRRPLKERELALIGELAVSQSVPSISPRTLFGHAHSADTGAESSVPRWEEEDTGSEFSVPSWEGPEDMRKLRLSKGLAAIGSAGSSHSEAKRDEMARGEAKGLAAALLMEIRAGTEDPLTLGELRRQRSERHGEDLRLWERGLARHRQKGGTPQYPPVEVQPELHPLTEEEVTRAEDRAALLELERELQVYRFEVAGCTDQTRLAAYAGRRDLGDGGGVGGGGGGAMGPGCRHACNHACRPVSAPLARAARAADLVRRRQAAAGAFEKEHKRRGLQGVKAALALHDEGERGARALAFDWAVDSIRHNRPQVRYEPDLAPQAAQRSEPSQPRRRAAAAAAPKKSTWTLETYATRGSNQGLADRVPGRSCAATHAFEPCALDSSIWAPRVKHCDSAWFYDTPSVMRRMFETDWQVSA